MGILPHTNLFTDIDRSGEREAENRGTLTISFTAFVIVGDKR
jgi:hypothetical protein